MGQVCLVIRGVQVDPVTGDLVPVSTARRCRRFGFDINLAPPGRVFLREWIPGPRDPIGPVAEAAIHEIGGPRARGHGGNTLVVRAGDEWNRDVAVALRDGLASSRRRDAGLLVLVLFPDGTVMRSGAELMAQFGELAAELEAPLVVNEDVGGSWSKALRMDGAEEAAARRLAWRLISPTGGVTWAHRGPTTPRELASALDDYLFPSPAAAVTPIVPGLELGARASSLALGAGLIEHLFEVDSPCPPPPLGRFGVATGVTFVTKNSAASDAALRNLAEEHGRRTSERVTVVIVDGAGAGDLDELSRSLPEGALFRLRRASLGGRQIRWNDVAASTCARRVPCLCSFSHRVHLAPEVPRENRSSRHPGIEPDGPPSDFTKRCRYYLARGASFQSHRPGSIVLPYFAEPRRCVSRRHSLSARAVHDFDVEVSHRLEPVESPLPGELAELVELLSGHAGQVEDQVVAVLVSRPGRAVAVDRERGSGARG
jgi:hypothetical protein